MKRFFHLFFLNTKNLGVLLLVPLIIIFVLLPLMIYHTERSYGINDDALSIILKYIHSILPFSCAAAMLFSLRGLFEEKGNELVRLYSGKSGVFKAVNYLLFHFLISVPLFLWLFSHYDGLFQELIMLLSVSLFLGAAACCLLAVTHSATFPLVGLILYFAYIFINAEGKLSYMRLNTDKGMLILILSGVTLLCVSAITDNLFPRYN